MQTKTQRCGCSAPGCGCGGRSARLPDAAAAPCTPCETAAFVRPRFFAGQLLTEDDLGALIDYTLAKQRFRNAWLFGAGVVCGLEAACGPCDSSQLVVEPGYAIDDCGNDLVLGCTRTLDLAPMIRELQARERGGIDCAEPCPPPAIQAPPAPHRHYDLYARYTERADQPVAAYQVDDDCSAASCEPTRILEGLAFELRCPAPAGVARTMSERLAGCAAMIEPSEDMTAQAVGYARLHRQLGRALARRDDALDAPLDAEDLASLREGSGSLEAMLAGDAPAHRLVALGRYLTSVSGPFARMQRGKVAVPEGVDAEQIARNARHAAETIASSDPVAVTPLQRTLLVEAARLWKEASEPGQEVTSVPMRLYLAGAVVTPAVMRVLADEIAVLAMRFQAVAGCREGIHTDCALRELADTLAPRWNPDGELTRELTALNAQLGPIVDAISRLAEDCRCAAINPRCPASDGEGVLLARIEVDRCKVVRICNTVRPYVLAPATLRYWGAIDPPDLGETGEPVPAADPVALASELAALQTRHAHLERRLGRLEEAERPVAPAARTAARAKTTKTRTRRPR